MSEDRAFRKAAVGGFHRKDVIDYIEQLLIEQYACRKELAEKDEQIAALRERVAELERTIADMKAERDALPAVIPSEEDPDEVPKQVDRLLKSYLGAEAD